ncbi:MAG: hydrogenase subunit MbhD domain-containing protein [Thermodesulfobacteriota bacterium]
MTEFGLVNSVLLFFILVTSLIILIVRSLFAATIILSLYSFLMSLVWLNLDAVDVALTEAAVGTGISTILLIGALVLVGSEEKAHSGMHWPAFLLVSLTTGVLIYGMLDMPAFGDPGAPPQVHVAPEYISQTVEKIRTESGKREGEVRTNPEGDLQGSGTNYFHGHVPNLVTSVIVDYRAYDTLFEVVVIFTAGLSLILLLRGRKSTRKEDVL